MIYLEPWQQQAIQLAAMLNAATVAGGKLAGYTIEEVAPAASEAPLTIGWQFRRANDVMIGQNRIRQTAVFEIVMIVERGFSNTQTDAAKQAKLAAENAWNDRAGHGLGPTLRQDVTLGGTAISSTLSHVIQVGRSIEDETDTSAIVIATLTTIEDAPIFQT